MATTILSIANSDVEIAITMPKHPEAHSFLYEVLDELGIDYDKIVDEKGAERTPRELTDAYALYATDASSVSVVWASDMVVLLVRPADRARFAGFLDAKSTMHVP